MTGHVTESDLVTGPQLESVTRRGTAPDSVTGPQLESVTGRVTESVTVHAIGIMCRLIVDDKNILVQL